MRYFFKIFENTTKNSQWSKYRNILVTEIVDIKNNIPTQLKMYSRVSKDATIIIIYNSKCTTYLATHIHIFFVIYIDIFTMYLRTVHLCSNAVYLIKIGAICFKRFSQRDFKA